MHAFDFQESTTENRETENLLVPQRGGSKPISLAISTIYFENPAAPNGTEAAPGAQMRYVATPNSAYSHPRFSRLSCFFHAKGAF